MSTKVRNSVMKRIKQSVMDKLTSEVYIECTFKTTEFGEANTRVRVPFKVANDFVRGFSTTHIGVSKDTLTANGMIEYRVKKSTNFYFVCRVSIK